jgi:hypothetical protein
MTTTESLETRLDKMLVPSRFRDWALDTLNCHAETNSIREALDWLSQNPLPTPDNAGEGEDPKTIVTEVLGATLAMYGDVPVTRRMFLEAVQSQGDKGMYDLAIEYAQEAEHQDGNEYWNEFPSLDRALADLRIYADNIV